MQHPGWALRVLVGAVVLVMVWTTAGQSADPLVPSRWKGEISGTVQGQAFRLPLAIEFRKPLPAEKNPLNLFLGAGEPAKDVGHLLLQSAVRLQSGKKPATLQYLTVFREGDRISATLASSHRGAAAAVNGFTGPNVSAQEASDLMRGVLQETWGTAEMFAFSEGTAVVIDLEEGRLSGTVAGEGGSYTGTSAASYSAIFTAARLK